MHKKFFRKPLALLLSLICMMSIFSGQVFATNDTTVVSDTTLENGIAPITTFTNNMAWTGGNNDTLILTRTMKRLTYQGTFNLFGTHGVVVLYFDLLDSSGNVVDGRAYTFACNGSTYTSEDFLFPWPAGRYRVRVEANTTKNLNTLFINFES